MRTEAVDDELLVEAVALARGAGQILASYYGRLRRGDADRKAGRRRDLVSTADRESERYLFDRIPAADDLVGEEGSARLRGAERRWIVDPLDGTVNFLHGIPFWAVSIAIVEGDDLRCGVVHAPALGQTFAGSAGQGAFVGPERLEVSPTGEIAEAVLATGFAYARDEVEDNNLDNWSRMALEAAGLRRMGSASIDLAYTAAGHFDGFWELHLNPWDVAAGALLVREAGGTVTDFHGNDDLAAVLDSRHIVASNGRLHEAIRSRLAPLRAI